MIKQVKYQIECGFVQGFYSGANPGIAFRKAMNPKIGGYTKEEWGLLARFRKVKIGQPGFQIFKVRGEEGKWHYQEPEELYNS